MKKQLLLSLSCAVAIAATGQRQAQGVLMNPLKANSFSITNPSEVTPSTAITFNYGDTLYYNNFSDSTVFTKTTAPGSTGFWVFGTDETIGTGYLAVQSPLPFASTSANDGYAMFDSDGFGQAAQNNASITVGPIDLSAATAPLTVNFEQWYARFQDSAQVWLSTDGVNFTLVGDNTDIPALTQNSGGPTTNPNLRSYLINDFAGEAQVWVRFRFRGNWDYTWLVDDLSITEVIIPDADVALNKIWHNDIFLLYEQEITPLAQADTVRIGTVIQNNGSLSQNVIVNYSIKRGATEVSSGSYTVNDIASLSNDTTYFTTDYVPTEVGNYTLDVTISLAGDATPNNNTQSKGFEISNFIYSAINPSATDMLNISYSGPNSPYNAYKVGSTFLIRQAQDLVGYTIAVPRASDNLAMEITIELYRTTSWAAPLAIGNFNISENHPTTFNQNAIVTRPFDAPVTLLPGEYTMVIAYSETERPFRFFGKDGDDDFSSYINGPFGSGTPPTVGWFRGLDLVPFVQMNFDPSIVGVPEVLESGIDVLVYPNPVNEALTVNLSFEKSAPVNIQVLDVNGKIVETRSLNNQTVAYEVFNTSNWANGVYTLQITSNNATIARRVVVAH